MKNVSLSFWKIRQQNELSALTPLSGKQLQEDKSSDDIESIRLLLFLVDMAGPRFDSEADTRANWPLCKTSSWNLAKRNSMASSESFCSCSVAFCSFCKVRIDCKSVLNAVTGAGGSDVSVVSGDVKYHLHFEDLPISSRSRSNAFSLPSP